MRKILVSMCIIILCLIITIPKCYAFSFTIGMEPNKNVIKKGENVIITISANNLNIGGNGMCVMSAYLDYDTDVFETVTESNFNGLNGWSVMYYATNKKLILENSSFISNDTELFTLTLNVKQNTTKETGKIKILNPQTSNNTIDIIGTEGDLTLYMNLLSSEVYEIIEETKKIKNIDSSTIYNDFKNKMNVGEESYIEILNKNNEVISNDSLVATGMTMKIMPVNNEYTLIVKGDINGDGKISTTDLSLLKQDIVESSPLIGVYKEAADYNYDGKVSITDLSQLKRVIIK